ncbi:MAG: NUDIX hydrolase [Tissierellales bacterium]|nr:NUDIX hydrolase [Tissierellales bacterium]
MPYIEKTMKSERIYDGKILNLRVDTVELPDKKYSKREIVEHPGAVAIVAINQDNEMVVIRQYRKAIDKVLLEIPAGKLELNEEPIESAKRELKEETGFTAEKIEYLTEFYTSPGFSNEKVYLFLAQGLTPGNQELEIGEHIDVECFKLDELIKMIKFGDIVDSKTIVGIMYYYELINK